MTATARVSSRMKTSWAAAWHWSTAVRKSGHLLYALASRGYKAGGVNSDTTVPDQQREFATRNAVEL